MGKGQNKYCTVIISFVFVSVIMFFNSCFPNRNKSEKTINRIDYLDSNLVKRFDLDTSKIVYQFYQEFGFTDLCKQIRLVSQTDSFPDLNNMLPISQDDLKKINSIPNKMDSIFRDSLIPIYSGRFYFQDIELDYFSYQPDSSLTIGLKKGKYDLVQTGLRTELIIFDSFKNMLYIEIHECDGN